MERFRDTRKKRKDTNDFTHDKVFFFFCSSGVTVVTFSSRKIAHSHLIDNGRRCTHVSRRNRRIVTDRKENAGLRLSRAHAQVPHEMGFPDTMRLWYTLQKQKHSHPAILGPLEDTTHYSPSFLLCVLVYALVIIHTHAQMRKA